MLDCRSYFQSHEFPAVGLTSRYPSHLTSGFRRFSWIFRYLEWNRDLEIKSEIVILATLAEYGWKSEIQNWDDIGFPADCEIYSIYSKSDIYEGISIVLYYVDRKFYIRFNWVRYIRFLMYNGYIIFCTHPILALFASHGRLPHYCHFYNVHNEYHFTLGIPRSQLNHPSPLCDCPKLRRTRRWISQSLSRLHAARFCLTWKNA